MKQTTFPLVKLIKKILRPFYIFVSYYFMCIVRRKIDFFEYWRFTKDYPIFSFSSEPGIIGNKCYGNIRAVKNKMDGDFDKRCMIEHGIYFGENVLKDECMIKNISTIYTYGQYRVDSIIKALGSLDKKIVTVGPYILYARKFHAPKKLQNIKQKHGKILLVFPSHSFPGEPVYFDHADFIERIKKIAAGFNSTFVSMYWVDIKNGLYENYKKEGWKIVCSGTRGDPYFLSRQRDLIELSDMTMSNNLGTHIGYCIALQKPHYLYKQYIDEPSLEKHGITEKYRKESVLFYDCFGEYNETITEKQKELVKYYWGDFDAAR